MADTNRFYSTRIFGSLQVSDGADLTASALFDRDAAVKGTLTVGNETAVVDPSLGILYTRTGGLAVRINGNTVTITPSQIAQVVQSLATTSDVAAAVSALVAASPSTLNTLSELASALGNDPNFATTIATALGSKAPLVSPTFTGVLTAPSASIVNLTLLNRMIQTVGGVECVALGSTAANGITTGGNTIAIGAQTLQSIAANSDTVAIGYRAGRFLQAPSCIAIGTSALHGGSAGEVISGGFNIGIGMLAMSNPQAGSWNVALGWRSSYKTTSSSNTSLGNESLGTIGSGTAGANNTCVGRRSLYTLQSGGNNTAVGYQAGVAALDASFCTLVGASTSVAVDATYATVIGAGASTPLSSVVVLGRSTEETHAVGGLRIPTTGKGLTFADGTVQTTAATTTTDVSTAIAAATATLAPLASPALTGAPTCPTPSAGDSSTQVANTSFVAAAISGLASTSNVASSIAAAIAPLATTASVTAALSPYLTAATAASTYLTTASISGLATLASPALTGVPTVPNAAAGTSTTQIASTSFVMSAISSLLSSATAAATYATKVSPVLTGTPTAPTAAAGTNTTQLATTAFVTNALSPYLTAATAAATYLTSASIAALAPLSSPAFTGTPTAPTQAQTVTDTTLATTAYVYNSRNNTLLRGTPTLETTPPTFDSSLKIATTAHVRNQLVDTNLTGVPVAPTPSGTDRSNKIATTNFVGLQFIDTVLSGAPRLTTEPGINDNSGRVATTSFVRSRETINNAALIAGTTDQNTQPVRGALDASLPSTRWVKNHTDLMLMRANIPAWLMDGTVATKGGWVMYPILCSTSRLGLTDSDDLWCISPGFTLVGYDAFDYQGSAWVIGSCAIEAVRATALSSAMGGGANRIASVKVYFSPGNQTCATGEASVGGSITLPNGTSLQYAQELQLAGIS